MTEYTLHSLFLEDDSCSGVPDYVTTRGVRRVPDLYHWGRVGVLRPR